MRAKILLRAGDGCSFHRIYQPFDNMDIKGGDSIDVGIQGEDEDPKDADILIFNRIIETPIEKVLEWQKNGLYIICDIDDLHILPPTHYLSNTLYTKSLVPRMIRLMEIANEIWTTNSQLKTQLLKINPNVRVFPNSMKFTQDIPKKSLDEKIRFSYIAGITHKNDVALLRYPFQKIGGMQDITSKAAFNLCGVDTKRESPTWNSMISTFALAKSYNIYGSLPLLDYLNHYESADVCLIPLEESTFNSCKSILKIIEAALTGTPCIVSNTLPYSELSECPGILWVNKPSDWIKHIKFITKNPDWIKPAGEALHKYISIRYDIRYWAKMRLERLHQICK